MQCSKKIRWSLQIAAVAFSIGCSDSTIEPHGDEQPTIGADASGSEVVVGAPGGRGAFRLRGAVTRESSLTRVVYQIDDEAEVAIAVSATADQRATFDVTLRDLTTGTHTIRLRAYEKTGAVITAEPIKVHVQPVVRDIPIPGDAGNSYPTAINNRGDVTGYWTADDGGWHGYVYRGGQTRALSVAGEWRTMASDINVHGDVVGYVVDPVQGEPRAMLWRNGVRQQLHNGFGTASSINDGGATTGSLQRANGVPGAYVYSGGVLTMVGAQDRLSAGAGINAAGEIAGTSYGRDGDSFAFVHASGQTRNLGTLGGVRTIAQAINDKGAVVGYSEVADRTSYQAFISPRDGTTRRLSSGSFAALQSWAYDVNNSDVAVGEMVIVRNGAPEYHGFVYVGDRMLPLDDLIGVDSLRIVTASAINDRGEIAAAAVSRTRPTAVRPVILTLPGGIGSLK